MKLKKLLTLALLIVLPAVVQAWDYIHTISDGKATITGYTGSGGDIIIPDYVVGDQYPVVAIAESAFEDCTNLTHVTIGNNVISIGPKAFHGCFAMTGIIIPENVTSIEWRALEECTSLTSCTIPNSIDNINMVFMGCTSLTSVTLPDSLVSLGSDAFHGCTSLTSITLPESIIGIGLGTFNGCTSLVNITIPDNVSSLGQYSFSDCTSLLSINIPDGVTLIDYCAFMDCSNLEDITIPDSVTEIDQIAFRSCTSLATVTIPSSVTKIELNAFENCSSLSNFYCEGNAPVLWIRENPIFKDTPDVTVYYLQGTTGWESTFSTQPTELWTWKDYTFTTAENEVTITGYTGLDGEITIPETIEGLPVSTIGGYAFNGCTNLTRITISENISAIKYNAFKDCSALTQLTIPAAVNEIGFNVFLGCTSLASFNVDPLNVTYSAEDGVLFNKDKTRILAYPPVRTGNYTIPNSVTYIGNTAFHSCKLTSITMGEHVSDIGNEAFYKCSLLKKLYCEGNAPSHHQENVFVNSPFVTVYYRSETIGWTDTFGGRSTALWTWRDFIFTVADNEVTIKGYIGAGGDITIPSTIEGDPVTTIGYRAFFDDASLTGVTVSENVSLIENEAFRACSNLMQIALSEGVTTLGNNVFGYCGSLSRVTIPDSVVSVGNWLFIHCPNLTALYFEGDAPALGSQLFLSTPDVVICYLPETSGWSDTFSDRPTTPWTWQDYDFTTANAKATITGYTGAGGTITLPETIEGLPVTTIKSFAFLDETSLTQVTILGSIESIGIGAFSGCSNLVRIYLPSVDAIGNGAFAGCGKLRHFYCKGGAPSLGTSVFTDSPLVTVYRYAKSPGWSTTYGGRPVEWRTWDDYGFSTVLHFGGHGDYETITITGYTGTRSALTLASTIEGNPVTRIGESAFEDNETLLSVVVPDGVKSINDYAFEDCIHLESISLPTSLTTIGDYAFEECALTTVLIPDGVGSIGNNAFDYCKSLTNVVLGANVSSIGNRAFVDCENLTQVVMGDNVSSIGAYAFQYCYNLVNIHLPDSVVSIGASAFDRCYSLETMVIPDGVTTIKSSLLSYCTNLVNVSLGNGITTIEDGAFERCDKLVKFSIPERVSHIASYAFKSCSNLRAIYFEGDAPAHGGNLFLNTPDATVYYLPGSVGWPVAEWGTTYSDRPTVLWNPQVQTDGVDFGMQASQFGFNITNSNNLTVVVEMSETLIDPFWTPVGTNSLDGGSSYFSDAQSSGRPAGFYRLRMP